MVLFFVWFCFRLWLESKVRLDVQKKAEIKIELARSSLDHRVRVCACVRLFWTSNNNNYLHYTNI